MITKRIQDEFKEYTTVLPGVPITAWQAYQVAHPIACQYDSELRWFRIDSDSSITEQGYDWDWWLRFLLMQKRAVAYFFVRIWNDTGYQQQTEISVRADIRPLSDVEMSIIEHALENTTPGGAADKLWQQTLRQHQPLPLSFYDSPEAVRRFIAQGANFVDYHKDFVISAKVREDGAPTWQMHQGEMKYSAPFATEESYHR